MKPEQAADFLKMVALASLAWAFICWTAAWPVFSAPGKFFLDALSWPLDGSHDVLSSNEKWLAAIGAGLLAGMSILVLYLIVPLVRADDKRGRNALTVSLLVWYVIQSSGALFADMPSNAVVNIVSLAFFLIPPWMVKKKS